MREERKIKMEIEMTLVAREGINLDDWTDEELEAEFANNWVLNSNVIDVVEEDNRLVG